MEMWASADVGFLADSALKIGPPPTQMWGTWWNLKSKDPRLLRKRGAPSRSS